MVKSGEHSAKFGQIWANLRNFGKKQQKIQRFLTKILSLESGPQHIHSLLSRFSWQPPFIEVLSGLLRAAYWPLVFSFSSFSGLFWPGPFFPNFRQWIAKRYKGVHCVDLGESFPTSLFLNLLFEQIASSNEYLLANFGFDTAENEP